MNYRALKRPPIVEAMVELRVVLPEGKDFSQMQDQLGAFREEFPTLRERFSLAAEFGIRPGVPVVENREARQIFDGFLFLSSDEHKALQCLRNAFLFSHVRSYRSWDSLRDEANAQWRKYVEIFKPVRVSQVGVRYINQMEFQLPVEDLSDLFLTYPSIGPELPQAMSGSLMRLQMVDEATRANVTVVQSANVRGESGPLDLVFDIGVFSATDLDVHDEGVWAAVERLRDIKNRVFFGSFTEKALERYQ